MVKCRNESLTWALCNDNCYDILLQPPGGTKTRTGYETAKLLPYMQTSLIWHFNELGQLIGTKIPKNFETRPKWSS